MKHLVLALSAVLSLAGCNMTPASLGITGPAPLVPPQQPDDSTNDAPVASPGGSYGPSIGPSPTGNGRFFNYN